MIRKFFLAVAATLVSVTGLFAQGMQELPDDPAVRKGVLDNGMTYYIRHNDKPAGQAEFWIFDNVGALQEEDSQQGLAHFLEHMAFNGTENFPGKNMISYLESVGVKFGANLNAFTAQEMTCYNMSNVPVREGVVDSALLVLHDWAYYITLDGDEIDSERGVILNEMRTRNTADWRIHEQTGPYLYGDSRYATRNVIGHEEGLKTFPHDALRSFYHRWYRTDMQAILIVGDFDVDEMEQKVIKLMSTIPAVENPEPKAEIEVPVHNEEPIVGVLTDPELTGTNVTLYVKREPVPVEFNKTPDVALMELLDQFMMVIANERLSDIAQQPNAPFVSGSLYSGYNIRPMDIVMMQVSAREGEVLPAFEAMYTEYEKMARYGFTQSEFDRAKTLIARQVQMAYDGRNDLRSEDYMWTYIYNFMLNKPMMSAEDEYEFYNYLLSVINVDMLNQFVQGARLTRENQVVIAELPSKEGAVIPTAADFENIITKVQNAEIAPMADDFVAEPLIPAKTKLKGSKVVKTETDQFGATVWTLKNGATVIVKPTDFKADEVLMQVIGKGGQSVLATEDLMTAQVLSTYVNMAGLGKFNASDLRKQLTGKMVGITPFINTYTNGFSASASPKDLETMFQLLYLSFTAPRFDEADYDVMMNQLATAYGNVASDPQFKLQEVMTETMYGNNPRREVLTFDQLGNISFEKIQKVYEELYSNPDDFTYLIVGNVDLETLKPMVEKYIGSLPKTKKAFTMVDDGVRYAQGRVENRFTMPMQMPKASVVTILNGEMPYSLENRLAMDFFAQLLTIRYTETMREEKGGTYGVSAFGQTAFLPVDTYLYLTLFDTEPAMVDELKQDIINEIEKMAAGDVREDDMVKIKEYFTKQYPDQLKQNGYWRNILMYYHLYGYDLDSNYMDIVNSFDAAYFQKLAAKILADGNIIEVIMLPEEQAAATECAE